MCADKPDAIFGQCVATVLNILYLVKLCLLNRTAQDQKGHIASSTLMPETKPQHEASRLKPQRRRETDSFRSCNAKINVCTYNTRTLKTDDDTNRLVEELGNIMCHVVELCETKRRGEEVREFSWGRGCMKQGKNKNKKKKKKKKKNPAENPNANGLALLINKNFTGYEDKFEKHSGRIISCKIKLHRKTSLQITQVYANASDHDDETVEMFYDELEKNMDKKA